jgi:lipopolysaccharide/colanic/teichoic acid biosynthesis glycosyltransferase
MYKFRTMTDAVGADGRPLPDSVRLTPLGQRLRSTSLDELPELFNVLRGDMSLVGPRPLLTRYTEFFSAEEARRLDVRPGITGLAQVRGRNLASWDDRLSLDVQYVRRMSPLLDLRVIWETLTKVVRSEGVVVDPESVMANFDDERRERASRSAASGAAQ